MSTRKFTIDDPFIAAGVAILTSATPEVAVNALDRVVWSFPDDEATRDALREFSTGQLAQYARSYKTLRTQMRRALQERGSK